MRWLSYCPSEQIIWKRVRGPRKKSTVSREMAKEIKFVLLTNCLPLCCFSPWCPHSLRPHCREWNSQCGPLTSCVSLWETGSQTPSQTLKIRIFIATRFASGSYACVKLSENQRICVPVVQDVLHSKQAVLINTPLSMVIGFCVSIVLKSCCWCTVVFILSSTEPNVAWNATIRFIWIVFKVLFYLLYTVEINK